MKIPALFVCASLAAMPFARAAADDADTNSSAPAAASATETNAAALAPNPAAELSGTNGVVLNFHEAPLNLVLDYLSKKAGYIISSDEDLRERVTLESATPVDREELKTLLNDMLAKNNYRASFNGRILNIKRIGDAANSSETEIHNGIDLDKIPITDTVYTWILPVHSLDPQQLLKDLEQLVPNGSKVSADQGGSAIIMTGRGRDIHHFAEIIKALDGTAVASVAVVMLKYGDAKSVASELKEIFQSADSGVARANRFNQMGGGMRFRGFGGFPGFGGGGGGGEEANNNGRNNNPNTEAVFTSDDLVNAVVAAAPPELMPTITNTIAQLDQPAEDVTVVRVFHLIHADPTETADELTSLFANNNNSNDQNNRGMGFRFFRGRFGGGGGNGNQESDRMKKQSQVTAVADPRTESIIVTASKSLMDQIEGMIADLDRSDANAQVVTTYDISTADPMDIQNAMQALFAGQSSRTPNNNQMSPLESRAQTSANQQNANAATQFGQTSGGGGGAGVGGR